MICIGPLDIDLARREARVDGKPVRIGNRAFDILELLIEAQGGLVSKEAILERVWPETVVGDNNLQVHMSALRKLLGERRDLIKTIAGRGYRLLHAASRGPYDDEATRRAARHADDSALAPNNLPADASVLVGRDEAIVQVCTALGGARHVTLVGSGGIGKTRIAIEVARRMLPHAPGGVFFVSLHSALNMCGVLTMIAAAIGAHREDAHATCERIVRTIGGQRMLIVLDSCEHVVDAAAQLANTLLSACPRLRVLSTSREPLRIPSETLHRVAPLDVPDPGDDAQRVLGCSAVSLFLLRARAIDARFASDAHSIQVTGMVCRRLDGIPLAIELAAARAALLGIDTLAAHLDDRFGMLTGGTRTALPRHQTLKATLDWSHALLDDAQRKTLRRIGVFAGGFPLEAAIAVTADSTMGELDVVVSMAALVEKSLVVASTEPSHASFRLLETTRMYARQKLDDNGERRDVALRHAHYLSALLEGRACADSWHTRMPELLDELRAALGWMLSEDGGEALRETLSVNTVLLFYELSLLEECCIWARRALAVLAPAHEDVGASPFMRLLAVFACVPVSKADLRECLTEVREREGGGREERASMDVGHALDAMHDVSGRAPPLPAFIADLLDMAEACDAREREVSAASRLRQPMSLLVQQHMAISGERSHADITMRMTNTRPLRKYG